MKIKLQKYLIAIVFITFLSAVVFAVAPSFRALADGELVYSKVLDFSESETTALLSPKKICRGEKYTAVNENNEKISVFDNVNGTKIAEFSIPATTFGEIQTYGDEDFLIVMNQVIYHLYFDGDELKADYLLDENDQPFGTNFDFNGRYLVVNHNTVTKLYTLSGIHATSFGENLASALNSPVAINDNDEIFYLNSENDLKTYSVNGVSKTVARNIDFSDRSVDMIATNYGVFYLGEDDALYFVSLPDGNEFSTPVKLDIDDSLYPDYDKYDLGNVIFPTGICLSDGKVLISDSSASAVQEFIITADNKLAFTGYAMADGKTAFNRISSDVKDVEKYKDTVAVADDFKITLFTDDGNVDLYSYTTFKNFFVGEVPERFALGNGKMLSYKDGKLSLTDIADGGSVLVSGTYSAADIFYQSGYFYVLSATTVYKINETDGEVSTAFTDVIGNVLAVDVFKTATAVINTVLSELKTDLIGDLYGIKTDGFYKYDKNAGTTELLFAAPHDLKSFALGFEDPSVYFVFNEGKTVYKTQSLGHRSVSSVAVPDNFNRKDAAINVSDLKLYSTNDNANLYSVDCSGNNFVFDSLSSRDNEYVLSASINVGNATFYALSGLKGVVLVNSAETEEIPVVLSDSPERLYVTTSVHMYALPVLTVSEENKLVSGENDYLLSRGKTLSTDGNAKFVFDGKEFYYCAFDSDNGTIYGYVPVLFTAEVLDDGKAVAKYTVKSVYAATVYADEDMTTELLAADENTKVRVYGANGNALKIAVHTNAGWVTGYVSADRIKDAPNHTVRNVLIIIVVAATLAGTASYFILRRKD